LQCGTLSLATAAGSQLQQCKATTSFEDGQQLQQMLSLDFVHTTGTPPENKTHGLTATTHGPSYTAAEYETRRSRLLAAEEQQAARLQLLRRCHNSTQPLFRRVQ
jgi:hypothetical protein